jgi:hypothetical protein
MKRTAKKRAKPRPAECHYSHRSLLDKLGVKPDQRVSVIGISDSAFCAELAAVVSGAAIEKPQSESDLIFLGAEDAKNLVPLNALESSIKRNGAIWVVYPKGQKHIRDVDVIAAGKAAGLVDNKVCRFSETHTALRFVIPLARR